MIKHSCFHPEVLSFCGDIKISVLLMISCHVEISVWCHNQSRKFVDVNLQVVQLTKFDYRLSNMLDEELQRLRCRANYHALKFVKPIDDLGHKLVKRMRKMAKRYIAIHLRYTLTYLIPNLYILHNATCPLPCIFVQFCSMSIFLQ